MRSRGTWTCGAFLIWAVGAQVLPTSWLRPPADSEWQAASERHAALCREAREVPITDSERTNEYLKRLFLVFPGPVRASDVNGYLGPEIEGPVLTAVEAVGLPATPYLIRACRDAKARTRELALRTIVRIGDDSAVPALVEALKDPEPAVRRAAAYGLGMFRATEALPALLSARLDPDVEVRDTVTLALGLMRVRRATRPLTELLRDSQRRVREQAAHSLGTLGCPEAVPYLIPLLEDKQGWVRYNAAMALRTLTYGIVTARRGNPSLQVALREPLRDLAQAYRQFWRTHRRRMPDEWLRESVELRIGMLGLPMTTQDYREIVPPLEQMTFQRFYVPDERGRMILATDKWQRWWAENRNRPEWEWMLRSESPVLPEGESPPWAIVVKEGGLKAIPVAAALAESDWWRLQRSVEVTKHLTMIDFGFAKPGWTPETVASAAAAAREWYAQHRKGWDVLTQVRRALGAARGNDFWIAARTLRWLGDWSACPQMLEKLESKYPTERGTAARELEALTGRQIGRQVRASRSEVYLRNYAANWRLWLERNAERMRRREPALPMPGIQW
jgi:hypothetical protein